MVRNSDYIYDVAGGWQPITNKIDEILNTSSFAEDHHKAIKRAGYSEKKIDKIEMAMFSIESFHSHYGAEYPYLLQVSNEADVNIVLIANYISLQKCISELVATRKAYIEVISS